MGDATLVDAVVDPPPGAPRVTPAGRSRMYAMAVLRDGLLHREHLRADVARLLSDTRDVYAERGDRLPGLLQILALPRVVRYRRRHAPPARRATRLVAAWFDGLVWNGEPIP
jgi:hypothetical protein